MTQHPSREQLLEYRDRTLSPAGLVALDRHLAACPDCRSGQAELVALPASAAMVSAVRQAAEEHLTYDQMDAWVEDQLDQSGRELVMAHIGLCSPCARQLQAYQTYAPIMSAPVHVPATPAPSLAERLRSFFASPRIAAITMAAIAIAILSPLVLVKRTETARREFAENLRSNGPSQIPGLAAQDTAELDALPSSIRGGALATLNAPPSERPAALLGLPPNADAKVEYPVSEVVEETQPELRWRPFATSYLVSVYDSQHRMVAASLMLSDTHWRVPAQLERGARYTWEVQAGGMTHVASFRVLGQRDSEELARVRATNPGPLALGAAAESLGLLSLAQQEFLMLSKNGSQSQQGAILLDRITSIRGR